MAPVLAPTIGSFMLRATSWNGLFVVLAVVFFAIAAAGLALPNVPALALAHHGARAGTAAALLGACQFGIGALLSPLVGLGGAVTATGIAIVIFGAALLGSLVLLIVARPHTIDVPDGLSLVALSRARVPVIVGNASSRRHSTATTSRAFVGGQVNSSGAPCAGPPVLGDAAPADRR